MKDTEEMPETKTAQLSRDQMEKLLEETVGKGHTLTMVVTGYSMSPFLRHLRDRVILFPLGEKTPGKLDIVLFRREDGKYVLHRIIRILPEDNYLMNGDAQVWEEQIKGSQIAAVSGYIVRGSRKISCVSPWYRICCHMWLCLKPMRKAGLYLYERLNVKRSQKDGTGK